MTALSDIIAQHAKREGPLLPILHDVQAAFGHVSEDSIRAIAEALNLTRAEVHGVVIKPSSPKRPQNSRHAAFGTLTLAPRLGTTKG